MFTDKWVFLLKGIADDSEGIEVDLRLQINSYKVHSALCKENVITQEENRKDVYTRRYIRPK